MRALSNDSEPRLKGAVLPRSSASSQARIRAATLAMIFAVLPCGTLWGQAAWQASGTSILYAPTEVNVGIGTASPADKLEAVG